MATQDKAVGPTGNPDLDGTGPRESKQARRYAEPHVAMTSSSCWLGRSDVCSPITARACFSRNAPNILSPKDCLVRSCLSATPSALHSWTQILASYGMIGQTAMGQVKISTLCRQGSILETLFVPHSGLRPDAGGLVKGPRSVWKPRLSLQRHFSLHRVVRAGIEFGAYQLAVHTTPPGFERLPCRQAAWCCDLRGAMALHGSGQGGQKSCPASLA